MKIKHGVSLWLTIAFFTVLVVTIFLTFAISQYFKEVILQRTVFVLTNTVRQTAYYSLSINDFSPNNLYEKNKTFSQFANEIDNPELVRLKIWSPNGEIIYSDESSLVGRTYPDNSKLAAALAGGHVVSSISNLNDPDNYAEKQYGQLIEIYIPIKSDSNRVVGVVEAYLSLDLINLYIENTNWMIFLISAIGTAIFGTMMFFTYYALRRNVINPIEVIHQNAKRIAEGDFNIRSKPKGYTELKALECEVETMAKKLKDQQERLVKTERISSIGELAARLAHDLRNPLNIIVNSLEIIKLKYNSSPEITKIFERINRATFRMVHQIEGVMDFVKIRSVQMKVASINEIIMSAIEKASLPDNIKVSLPQDDFTVFCDPILLEVVFENLLVNAKQAMKGDGTISIRTTKKDDFLAVEIEDSGPGIPSDVLPKIFEPLFTTKQEGTGLGLPSCRNIIEQHGGTLRVESKAGSGATFTIRLPLTNFDPQFVVPHSQNQKMVKTVGH
ncbi:MAG: HAMP domain-containing histidine kinase [Thaumarchaeota archaeon]|nr:HAMP domain-containing histidine kinase [Nitrososphaerota archaeon]